MIEILDKSLCSGCTACANVCPKNCITMAEDKEGFKYPVVDEKKCSNCGLCSKICPVINRVSLTNIPLAYAIKSNDQEERAKSSSGGVFSLIAKKVIEQGGIVYGVAMSEDCKKAVHVPCESVGGLDKLRGSKYLQSDLGYTFRDVKEKLDSGKTVLFSGTPCQIGGLKAYLGKDYRNLISVDLICHGVPSPKVWAEYARFRERKACSKIKAVNFRSKSSGWKNYSIKIDFENGKISQKDLSTDLFMRGFLQDLYLRPSCYNCAFKSVPRASDLTIADFWGIEKVAPGLDDNKGTSLVLTHGKKGEQLLSSIETECCKQQVQLEDSIKGNPAIATSVATNKSRQNFFNLLEKEGVKKTIKKYCKVSFVSKIKKTIKRVLKKAKRIIKK